MYLVLSSSLEAGPLEFSPKMAKDDQDNWTVKEAGYYAGFGYLAEHVER